MLRKNILRTTDNRSQILKNNFKNDPYKSLKKIKSIYYLFINSYLKSKLKIEFDPELIYLKCINIY